MISRKLNRKFLIVFILIFILGLIYSTFNIVRWYLENNKTKVMQNKIENNIIVDETNLESDSILDKYLINFDYLKKINSEVVGYIKVEGTNIDSTVVKHKDNSFYLNHTFDKSKSSAGWVFAHYKNKYDGTDKNYVLFGHSRKDGSMFGTLKNVLSKKWFDSDNKIIFITENSKSLYEVFSVYKIRVEDYYIQTEFENYYSFENFIKKIKLRSIKDFSLDVNGDDTLLTLSTCDSNDYRIVLHAKKIEDDNIYEY